MISNLSRLSCKVVPVVKKAVGDDLDSAVQKGDGRYADRIIVGLHGLRSYLGHTYRRHDVLHQWPGVAAKFNLSVTELPDVTTVCTRKLDLEMRI
jgi:hypothetical protein